MNSKQFQNNVCKIELSNKRIRNMYVRLEALMNVIDKIAISHIDEKHKSKEVQSLLPVLHDYYKFIIKACRLAAYDVEDIKKK